VGRKSKSTRAKGGRANTKLKTKKGVLRSDSNTVCIDEPNDGSLIGPGSYNIR
jgi:hypothetical protein